MPAFHVVLVIFSLAAFGGEAAAATSSRSEYYTQNAVCLPNNCVNPIFPGMGDMAQLDQLVWQCSTHETVASYMDFCKEAVNYNPSLPSPNSTSEPVNMLVKQQDDAAATMFFFHLNGLGYEPQEHRSPARSTDQCVKAIWSLVCFTYFPKAQAGCALGEASPYLRPCRNCCENYINHCAVECCDESVQCVFTRTVSEEGTDNSLVQTGYADRLGPSALCTGSNGRGLKVPLGLLLGIFALHLASWDGGSDRPAAPTRRRKPTRSGVALPLVLALVMISLQGCEVDLPHHNKGNWEKEPNYLQAYEFIPPGKRPSAAMLNSCQAKDLPPEMACSGRGYCREFSPKGVMTKDAVSFCECDRDWADPECRTRRKSQIKLFLLSLFGGFFGLDYFYLDYPFYGLCKLCSGGGLGMWWLIDVVRTGAGPLYGWRFRVAADLPHWVFVLTVVTLFGGAGFAAGIESYLSFRRKKRDDIMKLQESEEARQLGKMEDIDGPRYRLGVPPNGFDSKRAFHGYGSTINLGGYAPLPHGGAPMAGPKVGHWTHGDSL